MADFKQAIEWMKEGKKVERLHWGEGYKYHLFLRGERIITKRLKGNLKDWEEQNLIVLDLRMFEAIDWEIYKEESLSDKIRTVNQINVCDVGKIKESIKELKFRMELTLENAEIINEIFGDKLCSK